MAATVEVTVLVALPFPRMQTNRFASLISSAYYEPVVVRISFCNHALPPFHTVDLTHASMVPVFPTSRELLSGTAIYPFCRQMPLPCRTYLRGQSRQPRVFRYFHYPSHQQWSLQSLLELVTRYQSLPPGGGAPDVVAVPARIPRRCSLRRQMRPLCTCRLCLRQCRCFDMTSLWCWQARFHFGSLDNRRPLRRRWTRSRRDYLRGTYCGGCDTGGNRRRGNIIVIHCHRNIWCGSEIARGVADSRA